MTKEEEKYTTLDTEQCKWWVNHLFNMAKEKACNSHNFDDGEEIQAAQDKIIKALEQQSEDCVSRQAVGYIIKSHIHEIITESGTDKNAHTNAVLRTIDNLVKTMPPVTPTHGTCKDCKHWKDRDGVYRRGVGAESKCPVNNSRVFEGTFYCADFEKRGNENDL